MKLKAVLVAVALVFAVALVLLGTPALSQSADKTPAPTLTDKQKSEIRALQVQVQAVELQEYKNRDAYNQTQSQLDEQVKQLSKELQGKISDAMKPVDAKWVLNTSTLEFDPKPEAAKK